MPSIFEKLWRLGPSAFVVKAIFAAIVGDALLLAFILLRRTYRKRYFAKRDARVFELRQQWDALISGQIPYERWRKKAFDRRIVETIALDSFDAAGPEESARLLKFLRTSGLIEKRIFEARQLIGWRRMRALVALGRTRAPEGIPALAEGLRDRDLETRLAPGGGVRGRGGSVRLIRALARVCDGASRATGRGVLAGSRLETDLVVLYQLRRLSKNGVTESAHGVDLPPQSVSVSCHSNLGLFSVPALAEKRGVLVCE